MNRWADHLVIVPVALPLLAAALMLLFDERRRILRVAVSLASTFALAVVAVILMRMVDAAPPGVDASLTRVYRLGNWPAPFGIVLVLDRLSALMLVLTSMLACASLVYSLARWDRAGLYFHAMFQFLLMGLNGAFLTGDIFNLFVFFELLLAASYGLVLHGSGIARVQSGLHYIAVNLAASFLFLIGVSLIYAVTGTLNMADLAARIADVAPENRVLLEAGAAILGVAFLVKAGMWPLGFWLPTTYAATAPPVAALFAIMTKVGVYIVLRLWLLLFGDGAGESAHFGGQWLLFGGMMTIVYGLVGVLASQNTARLAGFSVLVSSGTLLAAIGTRQAGLAEGMLFYLVSSTLAIGAFFLLIELVERGREAGADVLAVTMEAFGEGADEDEDDNHDEEVRPATPITMAILGLSFLACALLLAGLPPLSGFLAKFALLAAILGPDQTGAGGAVPGTSWALIALIIMSGFATTIAMMRAGIRIFWIAPDRAVPRVRFIEIAPIVVLLLLCVTLTVQAGPAMRYMQATAESVLAPQGYIRNVLPPPDAPGFRKEGRV
jgi:multicomponent K+:H+ antiporter subunit D